MILCGMPKATEAQQMRLAKALLRHAPDVLRGLPPDPKTRAELHAAFFECRGGYNYEDVAQLLTDLCPAEDWPEIEFVVDDLWTSFCVGTPHHAINATASRFAKGRALYGHRRGGF
jgi:hypothetical protein